MEELIHTLEAICLEHLVMRRILKEDNQIGRVRELCRLKHYRDAAQAPFREMLEKTQAEAPNEITAAQLLEALSTTNLGEE